MRKILLLLLSGALILSLSLPAAAVNVAYDNRNTETDRVVIAQAERPNTAYTGQGKSHTQTDTRTREEIEDDATKERIMELEGLIQDTINEINFIEQGQGQLPYSDSDLNPFPEHAGGKNPELPSYSLPGYVLPEYELPDWALPEFTLPALPEWTLPEIDVDHLFEDGEKAFDKVYVIDGGNGVLVVDQVSIPIAMLGSYVSQLNNLNDNTFDGLPTPPTPTITIEDIVQPSPTPTDISGLIDAVGEWIEQNTPSVPPDFDIEDTIGVPDMNELAPAFPDSLIPSLIPGTNIEAILPADTSSLYNILMRYLQELQSLGRNHVNVTRIAQYNVHEYAIRTIRTSTPLNEYRWEVTGSGGTVDTQTDTRMLKLLFRSAGTYHVRVYNNQQVVRNNKVSGEKREIWMLGNNDAFNGLVVYNNATAFEAFIAQDIGPALEEIELVRNGFIANVTPQMVNQVQLIDTQGNIRRPSDGHTTERQ